jgi:hypothetical protein
VKTGTKMFSKNSDLWTHIGWLVTRPDLEGLAFLLTNMGEQNILLSWSTLLYIKIFISLVFCSTEVWIQVITHAGALPLKPLSQPCSAVLKTCLCFRNNLASRSSTLCVKISIFWACRYILFLPIQHSFTADTTHSNNSARGNYLVSQQSSGSCD